MGHFVCHKSKIVIYDAPKTGGTTIRRWIYYYLNREEPRIPLNSENYLNNKGFLLNLKNYKLVKFKKYPKNFKKICVYRDPVERFISCFNDKIIKEGNWRKIPNMKNAVDVDSFFAGQALTKSSLKWKLKKILGINNGSWKNYLNFHFEPLTYHYGKDRNYFNEIYNLSNLNKTMKPYLENLWGIKLPSFHMRNSKLRESNYLTTLSTKNLKQVKEFYNEDYRNGWDYYLE